MGAPSILTMVVPTLRVVARSFLLVLAILVVSPSVGAEDKVHVVGAGHSLWKIAKRYHVSVEAIREKNGLKRGDPIKPGQKLIIPGKKGEKPKAKPKAAKPPKRTGNRKCATHEVASGQALWGIAKRFDVSVDDIRAANGLRANQAIQPGQQLLIPTKSGTGSCRKADDKKKPKDKKTDEPDNKPSRGKSWVTAKPAPWTQTQKSAKDRGVNPCNTPNPGYGVYDRWNRAPSIGQMISPQKGGVTRSGRFDVMFHFHGHEPVRKEWVKVMNGPVLFGVTLGIGSGPYESAFRSRGVFERLVKSVEKAVAKKTGKKNARVRKVGLSAWSAGYGAVGKILRHPYGKRVVDTVVLLDGLHSGYQGDSLNAAQLKPFVDFARRAASGQRFMFVSHSSIIPPNYASTTETANYLISKLGGKPRKARPRASDPMGLELIATYRRGNFHVRGYKGNDKMDHCAHIGLAKDIFKVRVKPRWRSPRGRKR